MKASQPQSNAASESFKRHARASGETSPWHALRALIMASTKGGRASSDAHAGAIKEAAS